MPQKRDTQQSVAWRLASLVNTPHGEVVTVTHPLTFPLGVQVEFDDEGDTVTLGATVLGEGETRVANKPFGGLTNRRMREIKWADAERAAREFAHRARVVQVRISDPGDQERIALERLAALQSSGSPTKSARLLAMLELCERYEVVRGTNVAQQLASEFHISVSQVRNRMYEARQLGFFTAAPRAGTGNKRGGRAGGTMTDEGRALLAQLREEPSA